MSIGINDALSKLYLKLGGNPQDIRENKSITDYIDDLGDVLQSLAELPGVSSSDNGKVLKVINGTWAKGDVPNRNEALVINISFDDDTEEYASDKTIGEIYQAFFENKILYAKYDNTYYMLATAVSSSTHIIFTFTSFPIPETVSSRLKLKGSTIRIERDPLENKTVVTFMEYYINVERT